MQQHLFARICRVLGRFFLCIGAIFTTGSLLLAVAPSLFQLDHSPETIQYYSLNNFFSNSCATSSASTTSNPALLILGLILTFAILAIFVLALKRYNHSIRHFIARLATQLRLSIHNTELLLTTFIWGILVIVAIAYLPIFAIPALVALAINDLLFIFAWTAYGCPVYVL